MSKKQPKPGMRSVLAVNPEMDEWWCNWYTCTNCQKNNIAKSFVYCPTCGRKIDWTNSDKPPDDD